MSADLLSRVRAGDRRALARALTLIENRTPEGEALESALWQTGGCGYLVGITGPPGAGKSTLIGSLVSGFRARGLTVAVLAIDPTSPRSGGALLGDRIRMLEQSADLGVFIRSVASRGRAHGLAPTVASMALLLEACGFDIVLIETVGAGQDDSAIVDLVDTALLVLVPGLGDSIQLLKAGVLEVVKGYVVNKADTPGAQQLARELRALHRLGHAEQPERPVFLTTATTGAGVDELTQFLLLQRQATTDTHQRQLRRLLAEARYRAVEAFTLAVKRSEPAIISELAGRTPAEAAQLLIQHAYTMLFTPPGATIPSASAKSPQEQQ